MKKKICTQLKLQNLCEFVDATGKLGPGGTVRDSLLNLQHHLTVKYQFDSHDCIEPNCQNILSIAMLKATNVISNVP